MDCIYVIRISPEPLYYPSVILSVIRNVFCCLVFEEQKNLEKGDNLIQVAETKMMNETIHEKVDELITGWNFMKLNRLEMLTDNAPPEFMTQKTTLTRNVRTLSLSKPL